MEDVIGNTTLSYVSIWEICLAAGFRLATETEQDDGPRGLLVLRDIG